MIVVIGGTPGSGKTTAAEMLAREHGLALISSGQMFREEAVRRGMTLSEFGKYAQKHHEVDRELDRRMTSFILEQAKAGDLIVDSRLQAYLLKQEGVEFFASHIDAPLRVRAQRVAGREAKSIDQALMEIQERERSETSRYRTIYHIDIGDLRVYDLVIDSSDKSAEQVASLIWSKVPR